MKIVVAMKQIPDLQQVRIRNREPVLDDVPLTFGNIDKNALEAAIQIKEDSEGQVIALCVGSDDLEDTVKEALAAGADEARLVISADPLDSNQNAHLIAMAIKELGAIDLILLGEGSGDNYSSQVGSRVAQILGLPQAGYVNCIELIGDKIKATRSLEDSEEVLEISLPAVLTVSSDINQPRIPSVTQILKAGKKPRESQQALQLSADIPAAVMETISNLAPENQRRQISLSGVTDLVKALESEGFGGKR